MSAHSITRSLDHSIIRSFDHSIIRKAPGFTLVELIVVIGIIAILAGVLFATMGGGTESARTARCLSNMRNLAAACQTYGQESGRYPHAGSIEYQTIDESEGIAHVKSVYREEPGWISWNSRGKYANKPSSPMGGTSWMTSMYSDDDEERLHALTNGVLWRYVAGNRETYVCPSHAKKTPRNPPAWSYLMNGYFGWYGNGTPEGVNFDRIEYGRLAKADKVLLFCEVPFTGEVGSWQPEGSGAGTECDCVLQFDTGVETKTGGKGAYSGSAGKENIGFNHKSGKMTFANVVFADGHVEKLRLPKSGMSDGDIRNLTAWLCTGTDVSFDGRSYQKMDN